MVKDVLKTTNGKIALVLAIIGVIGGIGLISDGDVGTGIGGAALFLVGAAVLFNAGRKDVLRKAQIASMPSSGLNKYVSQEDIDAFERDGTLPDIKNTPALLQQGETAVFCINATREESKSRVVGHKSTGRSTSVRIAKGVTVRSGGGDTQSVYGTVTTQVSGMLVVTTKRIIFVAKTQAFEEQLSAISALSNDHRTITLVTSKHNHVLAVSRPDLTCRVIRKCVEQL